MSELRCKGCSHWLGESPVPLVYVESVKKSAEARITTPRDLRLCKSCGYINVFIARADLEKACTAESA